MCASTTTVRIDRAPEFSAPAKASISVFGVFHDGTMSEPAWLALAPKVSSALGSPNCEIGYSQHMRSLQPELATALDKTIRENGIDDDVLSRVAPSASGDFVMVLMSYRRIPGRRDGGAAMPRVQAATPMQAGRRMRGPGMSRYAPPEEDHVFELSASLYSVSARRLVAQIDLRHSGDDLDEAMDAFTQKLHELVPGAQCVGWRWPDPDAEPDGGARLE